MYSWLLFPLVMATAVMATADNKQLWPDPTDYGALVSSQVLAQSQSFANSFGQPFTAQYSPPSVSFNKVVLELQVNTSGANYDRLGLLFFDGIEVWRTSTSEPANDNTYWDFEKDVSHYLAVFQQQREFKLLINNVVDQQHTGVFHASVIVKFYQSTKGPSTDDAWAVTPGAAADKVVALQKSSDNNYWSLPSDDLEVSVGPLDRSVNRAVVHVFASGNSDDEFWWDTRASTDSAVGPSRFVDVSIGGQLAGFATPFPILFTGGVNAYLWKPLVGIRAYDVPGYYIDVTPFLPKLWDGSTSISVKVTNGIDNSDIPSDWIVNANLMTWSTAGQSNSGTLDTPESSSQGSGNTQSNPQQVQVSREFQSSATLNIGGKQQTVQWIQNATFASNIASSGNSLDVVQHISGADSFSGAGSQSALGRTFDFPLNAGMSDGLNRVQESYNVVSPVSIYTWIDSSVTLSGGNVQDSNSSAYLTGPLGAHFSHAVNGNFLVSW